VSAISMQKPEDDNTSERLEKEVQKQLEQEKKMIKSVNEPLKHNDDNPGSPDLGHKRE